MARQVDAEAAGPVAKAAPPQGDAGDGEQHEHGGADGVDLSAVAWVEQEVDVEVVCPLDPGARCCGEGAGAGVCDEMGGVVVRQAKGELVGGDVGVGRDELVDGAGGIGALDVGDDGRDADGMCGKVVRGGAREGKPGEFGFKDKDGAGEGDDDEIEGEEDACPQVHLEGRLAEPELAGMVEGVVQHGWRDKKRGFSTTHPR